MPHKRTSKNRPSATSKQENHERVSFIQADVLGEAIFASGLEPPVQFIIKTPGGIIFQPSYAGTEGNIIPPASLIRMVRPGVVLLPSQCAAYGSQAELIDEIKSFIHRYSEIPPFWEDIEAHYVLMTWVYDRFTAMPYFRVLGEPGTGKSRTLQIMGHLSYKGIFAGGAVTSSPLFRLIEVYRGTLVIDEADYKASESWVDIIKILNCGYMRGLPVLRSEKVGDTFEPHPYDVYGPKIIGNRKRFEDRALETRCLTLQMQEYNLRREIPRQLPPRFYEEARELRNKLLRWRFDNYFRIEPDESALLHLEARLAQIGTPLYSVSEDAEFRGQFVDFLRGYGRDQQTEAPQALVVQALCNLCPEKQTQRLFVQKVANEMNRLKEDPEWHSAKEVGGWLRSLGFSPTRVRDGYQFKVLPAQLEKLVSKYQFVEEAEVAVVN